MRTLWGSGGFAAFDTLIKALYIFAFHVPLYLYGCALQLESKLQPWWPGLRGSWRQADATPVVSSVECWVFAEFVTEVESLGFSP